MFETYHLAQGIGCEQEPPPAWHPFCETSKNARFSAAIDGRENPVLAEAQSGKLEKRKAAWYSETKSS